MRPQVIITFDDGYIDHFSAAEYLKSVGLRAVFSITVGWLDRNDEALNLSHLKKMKEMGHMVCNHSWSHFDPTTITIKQSLEDCDKAKHWLIDNGFAGDYIIMPFGGNSILGLMHLNRLREEYKWVRSVRGTLTKDGFQLNYEMAQALTCRDDLRVMPITAICGVKCPHDFQHSVDCAIQVNGIAVGMYHRVRIPNPTPWDCTWQQFKAQADYISTQVRAGRIDCVLPDKVVK